MKHILLVDDNTTNLKMAAEVLKPYYELSMAKSGKQALTFLKKNKPDLIILDLLMPEMNGYETMEEIKLDPSSSDIPIIFLTADTQRESEIKSLQMGALDFITKPFEEDVMLARIDKVLMMDDMRRKIFNESEKDSSTGLYKFDYVKSKFSNHLQSGKGGALLLINIDNMNELREIASSKSFSNYMEYFYDYLGDNKIAGGYSCKINENLFMVAITDSFDVEELHLSLFYLVSAISKEIESTEDENILPKISIGAALCYGSGDFDFYYNRADKALYHVMNSDFINYHIYNTNN